MDDVDPDDISMEELRQQTESGGDRLDTNADSDDDQAFKATVSEELDAIEAGDRHKTVSIWDGPTNAYLHALAEHPDRWERAGQSLRRQLDVDSEADIERSELASLALRLGLQKADPDSFEILRDAVRERRHRGL